MERGGAAHADRARKVVPILKDAGVTCRRAPVACVRARKEESRADGEAAKTSAETQPLVRFDAVSKHFGAVTAVEALTLDIAQCEFFALLGPSGCGKTTLLRMLAGFETPTEGRIL